MNMTHARITDLDDLIGKTIEAVHGYDDGDNEAIGIRFSDGTYAYIVAHRGYECAELEIGDDEPNLTFAVKLGIVSQEEQERIRVEEEAARVKQARWLELRDRETYERLKAKFEGGPR